MTIALWAMIFGMCTVAIASVSGDNGGDGDTVREAATVMADQVVMRRLMSCYQKHRPEALLSNNRMFVNLSREALHLSLPEVPVYYFLGPRELKR